MHQSEHWDLRFTPIRLLHSLHSPLYHQRPSLRCLMIQGSSRLDDFKQKVEQHRADTELVAPSADPRNNSMEQANAMEQGMVHDELLHMTEFEQQRAEVEEHVGRMEKICEAISKLHELALGENEVEALTQTNSQIERLLAEHNERSMKCSARLNAMEQRNQECKPMAPTGSGDMRAREAHYRRLSQAYVKRIKAINKIQQQYRDKYRQKMTKILRQLQPNASAEEMEAMLDDSQLARERIFASQGKAEATRNLEGANARLDDIKTLEKSIVELARLFLEMQRIVISQQDIINKVGHNVALVEDYTEEAAAEMKEAVQQQKSLQKKKIILTIVIIVGIILLLLFLLWLLRPLFQLARWG